MPSSIARCVNAACYVGPPPDDPAPHSLFHAAYKTVRTAVTLRRLNQIPLLCLPVTIQQSLGSLCINDFLINPNEVTPAHHRAHTFPATCLIDNTRVMIKLCSTYDMEHTDPAAIATFTCSNVPCCVLEVTETVMEYMLRNSRTFQPLEKRTIWKILRAIASVLEQLPVGMDIHPRDIQLRNDTAFYRVPIEGYDDVVDYQIDEMGFYTAPEVLLEQDPTAKSYSWLLGCIAYELISKKPAYCDRDKNGNLFSIAVLRSQEASMIPVFAPYFVFLRPMSIWKSLHRTPENRLSVTEIKHLAESQINLKDCNV